MQLRKFIKITGYVIGCSFLFLNLVVIGKAYELMHFYAREPKANTTREITFLSTIKTILLPNKIEKSLVVDSLSIPHQTVTITTEDNITLEGWYIPNSINKGTIIMFHGYGENKSGLIEEATVFYTLGWTVLLVDFRAHGNSAGNVCTIGYNEDKDVKAAYDFVAAKNKKNIVLWGVSLGAATITKTIHHYKIEPHKIILEMPFGSLNDAIKGDLRVKRLPIQPFATLLQFWGTVEQGIWLYQYEPYTYAKDIHCPVLLEWGVNDIRVKMAETKLIFKNLSSPSKTLVTYEISGHESFHKKEPQKWLDTVKNFL